MSGNDREKSIQEKATSAAPFRRRSVSHPNKMDTMDGKTSTIHTAEAITSDKSVRPPVHVAVVVIVVAVVVFC